MFVRIPVAAAEAEYWFETEERAAVGFYNRFTQLWNSPDDRVPVPAAAVHAERAAAQPEAVAAKV